MATLIRNPLATRPYTHTHLPNISPHQVTSRKGSSAKRARSPEPSLDNLSQSAKRFKPVAASPAPTPIRNDGKKERDQQRAEREAVWRDKYSRAFPSWIFYFDLDVSKPDIAIMKSVLEKRVEQMGARVDGFFSKDITHLITLHPEDGNKENHSQTARPTSLLGSPIRLKGRVANEVPNATQNLVKKALSFNIKVWAANKLETILDRCQATGPRLPLATVGPTPNASTAPKDLARLIEYERIHGTSERDPTQPRHGYAYFPKSTYFVLVEDMRGELATIAAMAYPITKSRDGRERGSWPVLHCHPRARGPFLEYDEREERRREKVERADREREQEYARRKAEVKEEQQRRRKTYARMQARQHDLRRTVSMHNLQRRATFPDFAGERLVDLDAEDTLESANASGYLASNAYMAASGNSVGITSTTGTTSALNSAVRNLQLPAALKGRMQQQVVTSRRFSLVDDKENGMPPPEIVPERRNILRKSRSTNTMKLPKREEGVKPGYCESCRVKFDDFKTHCNTRKHDKFAKDDANFMHLDFILSRVKRKTLAEAAAESKAFEDPTMVPTGAEDVRWDEWVDEM